MIGPFALLHQLHSRDFYPFAFLRSLQNVSLHSMAFLSVFVPVYLGPFKMNFPGAGYRHDLFWSEDKPGIVQELGGHFRKMVLTECIGRPSLR